MYYEKKVQDAQSPVYALRPCVVVAIPAVLAAQLGIKGGSVVSFDTNGRELIVRLVNEDV